MVVKIIIPPIKQEKIKQQSVKRAMNLSSKLLLSAIDNGGQFINDLTG